MSSPEKKPVDPKTVGGTSGDKKPRRSATPPTQHRDRSLSRRPRRSRTKDARQCEVVVEHVIEKTVAGASYPMLTRTNYQEWSLVMKVNFQAQGFWEAIDPGDCDDREDQLALAALLRAPVPNDMWSTLARKGMAKEAWEAVKTIRVSVQGVHDSNAQELRRRLAEIHFKEGETVDDFSLRITALVDNLCTLGDHISDAEVVKKMLHVVPESLSQAAVAIEMLLDLNATSVEEVTGRLRIFEQRHAKPKPPTNAMGRLLLCEHDWLARQKARRDQDAGGGKRQGRGRGRDGSSRDGRDGSGSSSGRPPPNDPCHNCGKTAHWSRHCRNKKKEEAHVAQTEEEHTLLLSAADINDAAIQIPTPRITNVTPAPPTPMQLDE
ncbi:unnamed protein product [Urochloa humidicola]